MAAAVGPKFTFLSAVWSFPPAVVSSQECQFFFVGLAGCVFATTQALASAQKLKLRTFSGTVEGEGGGRTYFFRSCPIVGG